MTESSTLPMQEPMLFPNMTVEENVLIGFSEPKAELRRRLSGLIKQLNWKVDLHRKAGGAFHRGAAAGGNSAGAFAQRSDFDFGRAHQRSDL